MATVILSVLQLSKVVAVVQMLDSQLVPVVAPTPVMAVATEAQVGI